MKSALLAGLALAASPIAAPAAAAAPRLDPPFSAHAVIQRDRPVVVTGAADPGESLTVTLGTQRVATRADAQGRFAARFAPLAAGAPVTITVEGPSGRATADDLLAGDVFLCSGQSNMELQVERAQDGYNQAQGSADPQLRLLTIDKATAPAPRADFTKPPAWAFAGPDTVPGFSAACFYMVQELRKSSGIPVGAIASSWGGTQISAWMGDRAQRAVGRGAEADTLALFARDPAAAMRAAGRPWEDWWRKATGDAAGKEPWQPDAALAWRPVPAMDVWEHWGVPELASYNGMVWFRREVTLSAAQARGRATLSLSAVDDMDRTWVNGVAAGAGGNPGTPRSYPLSAGMLRAGRNVIVVNANDVYANGGFHGPADLFRLTLGDGSTVPLGDGWTYAVEQRRPANPPRVPWDDVAGAGTIYNAMIAPFGSLGLKGVAWYQGESDTEFPGYADRLVAMMADWRRQFGQPDLPFAIVQLAGFGTPATAPGPSGWAALRAQQRAAVTRDGHAALALAIDLGDPLDIHPGEKHEVGRRLARAMAALAYRDARAPSGPAIATATATAAGGVELRFTGVTGALHTRSGAQAIGFELCGADQASCRYVPGLAAGDRVTLAGDGRPATRVRYAWADAPTVNLYDEAPLPAGPFEIAVGR